MANERITEDYVRSHFKQDPLFDRIKLEEQKSRNERVKQALKSASKKGTGNVGQPEFIITFPELIDATIVIECKPKLNRHESKEGDFDPENYALDGARHYGSHLKDEFDVLAIGVSGEELDNLAVSHLYFEQGRSAPEELPDDVLLSIYDYISVFGREQEAEKLKDENLLQYASKLNDRLYNYSVPEQERATIVSGILIALQDETFRRSFDVEKKPSQLVADILTAIKRVLKRNEMGDKTDILLGEYEKLSQSHKLAIADTIRNEKTGEDEQNTLLRDIVHEIHRKVYPFTEYQHLGYDVLGEFYSEFISYVNGDKNLGLVLTPQHTVRLFVELADLNKNDVIYDNCCGTGSFLIKSMEEMITLAGNDKQKEEEIHEEQVIGVEERTDMFTYACSNMMMRGDGKSNIILGDSLSKQTKKEVQDLKPTVGMLNPPYSTGTPELEFVYHNLECIQPNGLCIAIVPLNAVTADEDSGSDYTWKKKLMNEHTLEAVFSMPDDLFHPSSSTITAITMFRAHNPHPEDYQTYFGYWKDDGFVKVRNLGRVDKNNDWGEIREEWIHNYRNRNEISKQSVMQSVSADDEWCAEAYMGVDFGEIDQGTLKSELRDYAVLKLRGEV